LTDRKDRFKERLALSKEHLKHNADSIKIPRFFQSNLVIVIMLHNYDPDELLLVCHLYSFNYLRYEFLYAATLMWRNKLSYKKHCSPDKKDNILR